MTYYLFTGSPRYARDDDGPKTKERRCEFIRLRQGYFGQEKQLRPP